MLKKFSFESQEIRFVDGKPVANDVARILGYADTAKTVSTKVKPKNRSVTKLVTVDGKLRDVTVLEEAGIYQLIFGSKLPIAEKFQDWVFDEVLPSIRKTGKYELPNNNQSEILDLKIQLKSQEIRIATLELEILKNQKKLEENPYLAKILKLLEVKGEITAGEAYLNNKSIWKKLNMKTNDVGELLLQLVDMGKAIKVPTKKGIRIKVKK